MKQEYYLGLDMGTGSLGWAVTNERYEVLRRHGKSLWGVRLFENANTAEERRTFRNARRRLVRRKHRIEILQDLFAEEINKVDPGFYLRMKESRYTHEDKRNLENKCPELPYALFVDKQYTDKEYHQQFPTIYHLRKMLMNTEKAPDIRLVYLVLHHMMKHRGHFLISGDIHNIKQFEGIFRQFLKRVCDEELNFKLQIGAEEISLIEEILKNKKLTKSTKKSELIKILEAKETCEKALITLLTGGTVKLSDIFGREELNECERAKISFSDSGYDDYIETVETELGEQYIIIESAKAVYDWSILVDILGNSLSISEAKVAVYEKHKSDLQYLKQLVRKHLSPQTYQDIFVVTDAKKDNYCAYIGVTKKNGKKVDICGKQCTKEAFFDFLKKNVLNKINDTEAKEYLEEELQKGTFLPKQVTKDNSVLPYQLHLYELKIILDNLEKFIPIIKENKEKIIQLFTFRIPYYVGPLNGEEFAWAVHKKRERIYPWNFEEVIDVEASAERFIRRMTNKCTYLQYEDVLPKDSLVYSKFMVLNELNNLKLNGNEISVAEKQHIYEGLFQKKRKVTQKALKDFLYREGIADKDVEISGIDGDFKASLTAYHDFKEKLTNTKLSTKEKESIILNIVLFGDDKKLLKRRLQKLFPKLTEKQISSISGLSYKGWGRLSRQFLEEVMAPAPKTGEVWNIITALWETNDNLMQLLSERYLFSEVVNEWNLGEESKEISYSIVEQLAVSPAVKRQIWQSLMVVKELKKVMNGAPKRIFVEVAREKQESKRTESRRKQLLDLYKKCKEEEKDWISELTGRADHELRNDKLYLYYTQKGRCMYSGECIDIEELWDKYDIDHIYPQSKIMDDSLDNRVLVRKELNEAKSDYYPIRKDIRDKMKPFWSSLKDCGLISKEKFTRLIRSSEFETNELAGFIQRQLVETRQGSKIVAEVLQRVFPETEIVYTRAKNVTKFRQTFDLIKVREMNDFHHAKDAYLNIVVGNTYFVKFTKDAAWFIRENPGRTYNLQKMFTQYDIARGGEVAWKVENSGSIRTVKHFMERNDILVTRRVHEAKGGLFDQQLMKKGKGQIPIKGSDERLQNIEKYGGYNKATGTYFMLVESEDKKGKRIRTIEFVPLYLKGQIEENEEYALEYLRDDRGLKNPKICLKKIKIDTLFNVDGFKMWLSGRTGNQLLFKGANQLVISHKETEILKKVLKFVGRLKENKNLKLTIWDGLGNEELMLLYDCFLNKVKSTVYGVRLSAQEKTLTEKREVFAQLSNEEKCIVLSEILHMFQCQSVCANLKILGGPENAGKLVLNNNITNHKKITVLNQSVTGIYEQEIDLLTV